MTAARIIRKYPNRRLYDTEASHYITLADIRSLVLGRVDFAVLDKKTGNDITRAILLQVISEQEAHGDALMSQDFLSQVIRSHDNVMPGFMARYLEQSIKLFMTQQQNIRDQLRKMVNIDPVSAVTGLAQKNFNRWKSLQDEVLRRFSSSGRGDGDNDKSETTG